MGQPEAQGLGGSSGCMRCNNKGVVLIDFSKATGIRFQWGHEIYSLSFHEPLIVQSNSSNATIQVSNLAKGTWKFHYMHNETNFCCPLFKWSFAIIAPQLIRQTHWLGKGLKVLNHLLVHSCNFGLVAGSSWMLCISVSL